MKLITYNPYRILGLPITATEREIAKQINTLSTYAALGKEKSFDTDFPCLSPIVRTIQTIEEAKKQIEQNENKFQYSLFWFWVNNIEDKLAIKELTEGNTYNAIDFWERLLFKNKKKDYLSIDEIENLLIKQSANWFQSKDEEHILVLNENIYLVERLKETGSSIPTVYVDLNYDGNWAIECETEWLSGVENNAYGIILGKESNNYYTFQITANGYYCFNKVIEWNHNTLIPWKKSEWINKRAKNRIQIKKMENIFCFFVNDYFLETWDAEPFNGKDFGFNVDCAQKISFRNFKFNKLSDKEIYAAALNVSPDNFSWVKNLSVLYLSLAVDKGAFNIEYLNNGLALTEKIFTNQYIEVHSKTIAGKHYNFNKEIVLNFYLTEIIDSLKNHIDTADGLSIKQLFECFSGFPIEAKQFLSKKFVSKQIHNIDKAIKLSQSERKNLPANEAANIGKKLVESTKSDVLYLKDVLGESDFQYPIIADKLAIEIEQCGIVFLNETNDDVIFLPEYEFALCIVVTQRAKKRVLEILESCKKRERAKLYGDIFKRINSEILISQNARKSSPITACPTGIILVDNTRYDIEFLRSVLGVKDNDYKLMADNLAIAILECGIDFFNACGNDDIFQSEYEYALNIAVTDHTKQKVRNSLDACINRSIQKERVIEDAVKNKKLYEEKYPKCWFCNTIKANTSCGYSTKLYKGQFLKSLQKSNITNINIPRCNSCKEEHEKIESKFIYSIIGFSILSIIAGLIVNENSYDIDWFAGNWYFCLIIGLIIGFVIGVVLIRIGNEKSKIKSVQNYSIEHHPLVNEKLMQGWFFSKFSILKSEILK